MNRLLVPLLLMISLAGCDGLPGSFKRAAGDVDATAPASDPNDPDAVQSATLDVVPDAEPDAEPVAETPEPEEVTPAEPEKPDANAAARAKCVAGGGNFTKASGGFICVNRTRDANKSCTSSNQCQGACLARSGTCSPVVPLVGCHDIITNNGGMATLCVD